MVDVSIDATFGEGKTIETLQNILSQRMKYMGETARNSIAATAITALKSIRAITKVAKPDRVKVEVKRDSSLRFSCTSVGKKKIPCVRHADSNQRYVGNEKIRFTSKEVAKQLVFRYKYKSDRRDVDYIIVAPTVQAAKIVAKKIASGYAKQYAGLARRAMSVLMMKTSTIKVADLVSPKVTKKAQETTEHREVIAKSTTDSSGKYGLILEDNLKYALDAVKGGKAAVDIALKKAMNKIVSQINRKIKGKFLSEQQLETPFPEVRQRKN